MVTSEKIKTCPGLISTRRLPSLLFISLVPLIYITSTTVHDCYVTLDAGDFRRTLGRLVHSVDCAAVVEWSGVHW